MSRSGPARAAARSVLVGLSALAMVLCAAGAAPAAPPAPATTTTTAAPAPATATAAAALALPAVRVTTLVSGLSVPWDLTFTPDGTMIFDQRGGAISVRPPHGAVRRISANLSDLWASGETGLMGMVVDPGFAGNRRFYTCQGYRSGSAHDVRVIRWQMNAGYTAATRVGAPVVTGIGTSSGRHGGCRLRFDPSGRLYIGTGDAAIGTNPQNLASLNGKVLRVSTSGAPAAGNPFRSSSNPRTRLILTYGHRNVQGLALRPGTGEMWSVEQGTGRDDEVNRLVGGKNYGYNPIPHSSGDPSYNESVPMTDTSLPNVQRAAYSTGDPTLALSGGTWLSGRMWGSLNGAFIAAALKATSLRALTFSAAGGLLSQQSIPALDGRYGRLRTPQLGPDGALYVTTSNDDGNDRILRVVPVAAGGDPACLGARPDPASQVGAVSLASGPIAFGVATDRSVRYRALNGPAAFTNLGNRVRYGPAVASWDGRQRLDVFAVGLDRTVQHRWREGGRWSGWESLGFRATSSPAVLSTGVRQLTVLVRGTDNAMWMRVFAGHSWSGWTKVGGGLSGAPGALGAPTARVGVRGRNGYLYQLSIGSNGRPASGFVRSSAGICSAPGYSGAGSLLALSYRRHDGSADVLMNGIRYRLGGTVTGAVALANGTSALGFTAFARGSNRQLYVFDARKGFVGAGWRSLRGILI